MSYRCDITIKADPKTLNILADAMQDLDEADIEIWGEELKGAFAEDCTGEIFDAAKAHRLSLSYHFEGEEGLMADSVWEDGEETERDSWSEYGEDEDEEED